MGLKSFVFSLVPQQIQRRYILKKSGFKVIHDAKLTSTIQSEVIIPANSDLWTRRLSTAYGHEPEVVKWVERNLKADDIMFDIGANFGFYGVLTSKLQPKSTFYGFEANWFFMGYQHLNREKASNKANWHCIEKMVGDQDGGDFVSINSFTKRQIIPTVVVMDVDGEEFTVLNGADDLINKGTASWLLEVHPKDLAKRNRTQLEVTSKFDRSKYAIRFLPNLRNSASRWSETITEEEVLDEFYFLATPISDQRL